MVSRSLSDVHLADLLPTWPLGGGSSSVGGLLPQLTRRPLSRLRNVLPPRAGEGADVGGQLPQAPYYGWVLMVVLGITTIISYGTTQYLFGVLVVPLNATFGWGRASISGAYALGLTIAGLLGVPIGRFVDRWGARLLMSAGSALAALALF